MVRLVMERFVLIVLIATFATCAESSRPGRGGEDGQQVEGQSSLEETAPSEGERPSNAVPRAVTVTAKEYAFVIPGPIPAGLTTVRLANQGNEAHHLQLYKLEGGKSFEDLVQAMRNAKPGTLLPDWVTRAGGPGATMPGGESSATQSLEAGSYAAVCYAPAPDGTPHFMKGMLQPVEVVASGEAARAAEPPADLTIHLTEYDFHLTAPIQPGTRTIRVEAAGKQPHEVHFWRLAPDKSVADLVTWLQAGEQEEPPGEGWVGGVSTIAVGDHALFTASFEPGEYALICFESDEKDGRPHFMHGMAKQISVH